jgi:LmbE family N-acetylglucosaminyl deacetylase
MKHKIRQTLFTLLFVSLLITTPRAQQPAVAQQSAEDRVALYQALLDLTNPWTVMCIAAHPDDEDGTSLIVMRRKYGAHTVSLFSTFGEGGQNAIGPELYEELGAIRARETMAAAEIQGSEPHFLGLKDFGYSKTRDEAFKFWGHEEGLRRMVLEIRKLRPDVIITNHSTTSNDHGQHQATALMVVEAFDAAADPTKFPEQLKDGVAVWQVQRLFVRARGNQAQADTAPIVTIDPNERDPIRDTVFAEEALRALQKHATQGPWPKTFAEYATRFRAFSGQQGGAPGQLPSIRYRLTREAKGAAALPKDSHNFLDGLRLPDEIATQLEPPRIDGKSLTQFVDLRKRILDALISARKSARFRPPKSDDSPRFDRMDQRLDVAFAATTQVTARTIPRDAVVSPGSPTTFTVTIANNGETPMTVYSFTFFAGKRNVKTLYTGSSPFPPNDSGSVTDDWTVPSDTIPSLPHKEHLYDGRIFGDEFREVVVVNLAGIQFSVGEPTRVDVGPLIEIANVSPALLVITPQTGNVSKALTLQVINNGKDVRKTSIERIAVVDNPEPKRTKIGETPLTIGPAERRELRVTLPIGTETVMTKVEHHIAVVPRQSPTPIPEPTPAPAPRLLFRATNGISNEVAIPIVFADARVIPNLRVGYIRGFDFSLPNALAALGVESKELSVDEIKTADLQKYTSIIVDNRVYESQPELIAANQKLLDYAKAGRTLIVFYHKSDEWNPDERRMRPQLAPYKLILGNERITDETAPITFLEPQHPLLNSPNKMGQEDFANWIQERGLYYPKDWDAQFHALLQSNDPGEAPLKGGLLVADYGRGHYIYTSMVWYRELRGGVPGAYRMLANMISYGQAEGKGKK